MWSTRFAATLAGFAVLTLSPSAAQPEHIEYPWCANYYFGASNCGFSTFEQCMATLSGIGGSCEANQFYNRPVERSKGSKKRSDVRPYRDQRIAPFSSSSGSWPSYFFGD